MLYYFSSISLSLNTIVMNIRFFSILFLFAFCIGRLVALPKHLVKDLDLSIFESTYKGKLDRQLSISMFLNEQNGKILGIYFYDNHPDYLLLEGTINKTRHTIIYERNDKGRITGRFEGILKNSFFKGIWKKENGSKRLDFELVNQEPTHTRGNPSMTNAPDHSFFFATISVALVLVTVVCIVLFRRINIKSVIPESGYKGTPQASKPAEMTESGDQMTGRKEANRLIPGIPDQKAINKKKGHDFELFIIEKFSNKYFKCKAWRGDKIAPHHFPESNKYPDLELEFSFKDYRKKIAIECKYRSTFSNDCIDLGSYEKILDYKDFEQQNNTQVYIVLGVGGEASAPKELYLVPLPHIASNRIHKKVLMQHYFKSLSSNFFYDIPTGCLK